MCIPDACVAKASDRTTCLHKVRAGGRRYRTERGPVLGKGGREGGGVRGGRKGNIQTRGLLKQTKRKDTYRGQVGHRKGGAPGRWGGVAVAAAAAAAAAALEYQQEGEEKGDESSV